MAEIENPSFELAGDAPGTAAGWTLITSVAAWEFFDVADVNGDLVGFEDFTVSSGVDDPLTGAVFGVGDGRENFEKLWGPFDGSDPQFPTIVPAIGYPENAAFLFELGQAEDLTFHPFEEPFEDFDWSVEDGLFADWADIDTELAEFVGALEVENFEAGWGNSDFISEFEPADLEAGEFGITTPAEFESFEDNLEFEDVAQIVNAELGLYVATLNGVVFDFEFVAGDQATIVTGLIADVANSSAKFFANSIPAIGTNVIGFRVEDVNLSLTTKISGPNKEDVSLLSNQLRQDYWLLPDKTV